MMKKRIVYIVILIISILLTSCTTRYTKRYKDINDDKCGHYIKIETPSKKMTINEEIPIKISFGHRYLNIKEIPTEIMVKNLFVYVSYYEENWIEKIIYHEELNEDFYTDKYIVDPGYWIWSNIKFSHTLEILVDFSNYIGEQNSGSINIALTVEEYDEEMLPSQYMSITAWINYEIKDNYIYFG